MANRLLNTQNTTSRLPTLPEYQETIQHPEVCFNDPTLTQLTVDTNPWGIPKVISGGFALTYKLFDNKTAYAVRCFHKSVPDRQVRQDAISKFIGSHPSDFLVPSLYLHKGIRVNGNWYPINYMQWIQGDTLSTYLVKNYRNSRLVASLSKEFQRVVEGLETLGIAHGDLSAANIMVSNQKMVLIDYDGMYVPAFQGYQSNEIGNIFFQHPARQPHHFGPEIDRFSALVIYLALEAIACKPALWDKYESSDGILFRRSDFYDPENSSLLRELTAIEGFSLLIEQFRRICRTDLNHVPKLVDFVTKIPIELPETEPIIDIPAFAFQYPVLNGLDRAVLMSNIGERVTVIGQVTHHRWTHTVRGDRCLFFNFGIFPNQIFTIVFWSEALSLFENVEIDPTIYAEKWIAITGTIQTYHNKPQIMIGSPTDIERFNNQKEAEERLEQYKYFKEYQRSKLTKLPSQSQPAQKPISRKPVTRSFPTLGDEKIDKTIDKLYGQEFRTVQSTQDTQPPKKVPVTTTKFTGAAQPTAPRMDKSKSINTHLSSQIKVSQQSNDIQAKLNQLYTANKVSPTIDHGKITKPRGMAPIIRISWARIIIFFLLIIILLLGLNFLVPTFYSSIFKNNEPTQVSAELENFYAGVFKETDTVAVAVPSLTPTIRLGLTPTKDTMMSLAPTPTTHLSTVRGCIQGNLKLRSGPGEEFAILSYLSQGSCFQFDQRTRDNLWIRLAEGQENKSGWIASKWVNLEGSITFLDLKPGE